MFTNMILSLSSGFSVKGVRNLIKYQKTYLRNRSFNSQDWIKRREKDRYIEITQQNNYRCRSAFKLIEIDDKYNLINPGYKVLDIGAAPGSWSQVLAERTNSNGGDENNPVGLVIAIDINPLHSLDGVITISNMDFNKESSQEKILSFLGKDKKFDFICSDMAPPSTGIKSLDQERITQLIYSVIIFSVKHLKVDGNCLFKMLEGGSSQSIQNEMKRFFKFLNIVKPKASYSSSSECYFLGRQFMGLKT